MEEKLVIKSESYRNILDDEKKMKKLTIAAFNEIDNDGNGFLDRDELKEVMMQVAEESGKDVPTEEEVNEVLKELDADNDGQISVKEFQVLI